ncbi:MAG: phospho-N-acetylmuramoyl-pentapeptide-transferase [Planctomycetota bacterium]|nr:MAG: phospho-N-acetylmuramoyl-pentapeptide-transferase [Planctomycetota bacterium]
MKLEIGMLGSMFVSFFGVYFGIPWFIRKLRGVRECTDKTDSERLNQIHASKRGTPTMGGVVVVLATVLSCVLFAPLSTSLILILFCFLSFSLLGAVDDFAKVQNEKGIRARTKFLFQMILALGIGCFLHGMGKNPSFLSSFPLDVLYPPFAAVVIVASSNAVNLTDGLDGLAAGSAIPVLISLMALGLLAAANVPNGAPVPNAEIMIALASLLGSLLGFLWYNCHPAQIFMGDSGSLPLGAIIGLSALMLQQPILLIFLCGIFVLETLSVILQVASFKLRKKRIFKIAPLHHHYQFLGLSETKITIRFWIVSFLLAITSLLGLNLLTT